MNPKTSIVSNSLHRDQHGASVQPLYMSTTFKVDLKSDNQEYDYSRSGNPTRSLLHKQIGRLYGVAQSQVHAVSSGMTALDTIIRGLVLSSSSHVPTILAGDDLYGGSDRLLTFLRTRCHARTVNVDTSDFERFQTAFLSLERVDCVHIESPTNPMCKVVDVPRIIAFIKKVSPQTYVVVDNTMMSGLLCNPLRLGADVVYESATKFLNGHHDIMAGIIVSRSQQIADEVYFVCNATGSGLAPMDAWLLIRGLKTLHVRLYQQQFNAMVLAEWLEQSCGFQESPQAPGLRTSMSHASIDPDVRKQRDFPEDLIRLCVGIEDIVDLQQDLLAAMVDAGVLEVRGDMIHNLLNGHTARNTIGSEKYIQHSIYDLFYGGPQEKLEQKLSHRAIKL